MEIHELEGISEEITKMYVIIVVKRLEKLGSRATFEEMMMKNFVKLVKDMYLGLGSKRILKKSLKIYRFVSGRTRIKTQVCLLLMDHGIIKRHLKMRQKLTKTQS